jgi:glycosyltransferase involved in cell wall biosynthesis
MKICLDARGNHFGGVYTYTRSLLRRLPAVAPDLEFVVLVDDWQAAEGNLAVSEMSSIVIPEMTPLKMVRWNNIELPKLLAREDCDLYHGLKHFGLRYPRNHECRMMWTLHSASWWEMPELVSLKERLFWRNYYSIGARRLDAVVCVSQSDKNSFVNAVGVDESKVFVTHLAADTRFAPVLDPAVQRTVRETFRLPPYFILFVGTIYPFKNLEAVIEAFTRARQLGEDDLHLVLVGGVSPSYGEQYKHSLQALARNLGVTEYVHWTGSIDAELPAIYSMARALLFPSKFESFGQPVLEAMACGTPVITSNAAALPEVVGTAGMMRAHDDIAGLAEDLMSVLKDGPIRSSLIEKGYSRAKMFSRERCAQETAAVYRAILDPVD